MAPPVTKATHFENICSDDHILDDNNLSSYHEENINSSVASLAINNNSRVFSNVAINNQTLGSASSHHQLLTSCYCCR